MLAVVVYESMFGNTRQVAESIGEGLRPDYEVLVRRAGEVSASEVGRSDLLVVGGPTHAWNMSRPSTRVAAAKQAAEPAAQLTLEPGATGPGLREWLGEIPSGKRVTAFDTRVNRSHWLTGRASRKISKALRARGGQEVAPSQSFLVTAKNELVVGELERARAWGRTLATLALPATVTKINPDSRSRT